MIDTRRLPRFLLVRLINKVLTKYHFKDSVGMQFKIAGTLLPQPVDKQIISTIDGFDIIVDPYNRPGFIDNDLYQLGTYEPGIMSLMKDVCEPTSVIIDVGANIGVMTLMASRIASEGKVLSFEPIPAIFKDLKENIKLNRYKNIDVYPYALGSTHGETSIYPSLSERGSSSILDKTSSSNQQFGQPLRIDVRKLDEFTKSLFRVDLIKIDVEGYESEVLGGAEETIRQFKPMIVLEYDPQGELRSSLDKIISALPYDTYIFDHGKHYRSNMIRLKHLADLPENKLSMVILKPRP